MKGDAKVIEYLNKALRERTDRRQPVFPPRPHARQLGDAASSASTNTTSPSTR
jgi:hypothetical protein